MGRAYSSDLRKRISGYVLAGHSRRDAARYFGVSANCAVKLVRRSAATGSVASARQGRPPGDGKLAALMPTLIRWVEGESDITMHELAARLEAETGIRAHRDIHN